MAKKPEKPEVVKVEIAESRGWSGHIRILIGRSGRRGLLFEIDDDEVEIIELDNIITDVGRNLMAEAMREASALPEISWVALGDSGTAPLVSDTLLGNEIFRKQMTSQVAGATGVSISTVYIAPGEANQQINEIGWFAGPATGATDSGILIARVLFSRLKDNLESLQIERTDTIS